MGTTAALYNDNWYLGRWILLHSYFCEPHGRTLHPIFGTIMKFMKFADGFHSSEVRSIFGRVKSIHLREPLRPQERPRCLVLVTSVSEVDWADGKTLLIKSVKVTGKTVGSAREREDESSNIGGKNDGPEPVWLCSDRRDAQACPSYLGVGRNELSAKQGVSVLHKLHRSGERPQQSVVVIGVCMCLAKRRAASPSLHP